MSVLKPFNKLPRLNTATILLVEGEEQFQQTLADTLVEESAVNMNVGADDYCNYVSSGEDGNSHNPTQLQRLAKSLPLPIEHEETRPRIDLVVFIINLTSELSFQSTEASLKYLDPGYFLGKVCFMVTNARNASVPTERVDTVRKLAASLHCPLLFAEDKTPEGVINAAERLLTILKVTAGLVPMATPLYLSNLTRCRVPADIDQPSFD